MTLRTTIKRHIMQPTPNIDPAELAVFGALVEAFLDEMGEALRHGAFSQNIKERRDYSCALFDSSGALVCGAAHIPVHLGSMDTACQAALESIKMKPGDAVLLNDPYHGGTHLPDITLIFPVFLSGERPDFLLGVRAHHADVGGIAPGSLPLSTELSQEGLILPPTHLVRNGEVVEKVVDLLATHSRQPAERAGDLRAQLAAGAVGLERLGELAESRGLRKIRSEASALIGHSARVLETFLLGMKPGSGDGETVMDSLPDEPGTVIRCIIELSIEPSPRLSIDFTLSSDQHPGCLNATPAIVRSAVLYSLRLFLPQETPTTSGLLKPVSLKLRKGSVLDPYPGAAVAGGNVETSQAIVEALLKAFGELGWDVPAASQGTMNNVLLGSTSDSECVAFSFYETVGGGAGATSSMPGMSGIQTHMTNTRNTPIEALERTFPLRVRSYGFRTDSGGRGKEPGGDGIIREFEILTPTRCTILSGHRNEGPTGADGGSSGAPGRNVLIRDGVETDLPARTMIDLLPGDRLRIETPGGGGYGL